MNNKGIYIPVASGTVTQANMKISAVNGTSFIDFTAADVLTGKTGNLLVVRDSSGRAIQGFIKAAGTGETFGDNVVVNGDMELDSDWVNTTFPPSTNERSTTQKHGGTYSRKYTSATSWQSGIQQTSILLTRGLYYYDFWHWVTKGNKASIAVGGTDDKLWLASGNSWNNSVGYRNSTGTALAFYSWDVGYTYYIDDVSVKQVLTPSTTGVTIVSTKGGTTFNWAQRNSAFNYNDASGYTYQIYKVLDAPVVASGSITAGNALIDATTANAFAAPVGVDLSAYQTGKHLLALYDSSGYAAIGWISATAPSGEALGVEIATGTLTVNKLYKITATEVNHFGTGYLVARYFTSLGTETCDASNKVKENTMPAATGALLLSTQGGSRGYLYKHASFNPNAAMTYKVLYVGD